MRVQKRISVFFVAVAATAGLMACSSMSPQTGTTEAAVAKSPRTEQASMLERLFWRADANHDWRLTREEARGRLPITYLEFEKIDVNGRGWITLEQYLAFHEARADHLAEGIRHIGGPY